MSDVDEVLARVQAWPEKKIPPMYAKVLATEVVRLRDEVHELEEATVRLSTDNTRVNDLYDAAADERDLLLERMEVLSQMACENYTGATDSCLTHRPPPPNACWPCQIRAALTRERAS